VDIAVAYFSPKILCRYERSGTTAIAVLENLLKILSDLNKRAKIAAKSNQGAGVEYLEWLGSWVEDGAGRPQVKMAYA